jgi:hypothetical protein
MWNRRPGRWARTMWTRRGSRTGRCSSAGVAGAGIDPWTGTTGFGHCHPRVYCAWHASGSSTASNCRSRNYKLNRPLRRPPAPSRSGRRASPSHRWADRCSAARRACVARPSGDQINAMARKLSGVGISVAMPSPANNFELSEHPRADVNGDIDRPASGSGSFGLDAEVVIAGEAPPPPRTAPSRRSGRS